MANRKLQEKKKNARKKESREKVLKKRAAIREEAKVKKELQKIADQNRIKQMPYRKTKNET